MKFWSMHGMGGRELSFTCAFSGILFAHREHVTTVAAPIGTKIGRGFEPMWDSVIQFFFLGVRFSIRFRDTFGDNLRVAFFMAGVFAILALITDTIFEKVSTKSTPHNIVELLLDEFMAVGFMDFLFLLPDSPLSVQADVKGALVFIIFNYKGLTMISDKVHGSSCG